MVLYSNGHIAMFVHFFERSKTNQFVRVLWLLNRDVLKFRWKHSDGKKSRSTKSITFSIWDMFMQNLTRTKKKVGRAEKGIHWERRETCWQDQDLPLRFSRLKSASQNIFLLYSTCCLSSLLTLWPENIYLNFHASQAANYRARYEEPNSQDVWQANSKSTFNWKVKQ